MYISATRFQKRYGVQLHVGRTRFAEQEMRCKSSRRSYKVALQPPSSFLISYTSFILGVKTAVPDLSWGLYASRSSKEGNTGEADVCRVLRSHVPYALPKLHFQKLKSFCLFSLFKVTPRREQTLVSRTPQNRKTSEGFSKSTMNHARVLGVPLKWYGENPASAKMMLRVVTHRW
jgi:hypothetical protein